MWGSKCATVTRYEGYGLTPRSREYVAHLYTVLSHSYTTLGTESRYNRDAYHVLCDSPHEQERGATDYSEDRRANTMRSVSEFFMVVFILIFSGSWSMDLRHAQV